jgi:NADPH-dependent 2,4-dienoyl-CoA reductase/sulfur reductase-like enzyme
MKVTDLFLNGIDTILTEMDTAAPGIELRLGTRAVAIHTNAQEVELADGGRHRYCALLLATGAEPVRLALPGSDLRQIHYLRTLADSRALIAKAAESRQADSASGPVRRHASLRPA